MRLTEALLRQHIARLIKIQWYAKGKKLVLDTPAEAILRARGVTIVDAKDVAPPAKRNDPPHEVLHLFPKRPELNETHPDWNEKPRLRYGDNNVLVDGTAQAQVLLNTERVAALPERLESLREEPSRRIAELVERFVYSSHIFDAHQEKLPKKKDPLRPAYNFARIYGIPDSRKMHNFVLKILHICQLSSDPMIGKQRRVVEQPKLRTYIERGNDLLYFESNFSTMITSNKLLTPMSLKNDGFVDPLPSIGPLDPTISLVPEHIYRVQDHYPISSESQWANPHTIFVNFDPEVVKNITELPVNSDQISARAMLKSFATAACWAKKKFGEEVIELPEPITVQCVQSNGKWFAFSVYQLNTLDIAADRGVRNVWWSSAPIELYDKAGYYDGKPCVEGYNPEVFRKLLTFYRNV